MDINEYLKNISLANKNKGNCVYCAFNVVNKKVYIGYTQTTLGKRIQSHYHISKWKNESKNYFHSALMKYDKECFNWFILFESEFIKKLKEKESYFIKLFKSNNREFGYNLTTGGEQSYFNDEVKFKISKKAIERNLKGENNPFFGKRHSEEQKKKWSIDRKETNKGKENSFFGKHHSKETIELMKNICREKFKDKNVIENMRNSKKNSKKIICLNNGIIYKSISEAARQLNIGKGIIQSQLHNRQKKAKGYMFKFVE